MKESGCSYGVPSQKHQRAAKNSLSMPVRNDAQEAVSALSQASHADSFVFAVDNGHYDTSNELILYKNEIFSSFMQFGIQI